MREIDLIKVQNGDSRQHLKNFLIEQRGIYNLLLTGVGTAVASIGNVSSLLIGGSILSGSIAALYKKWKNPIPEDSLIDYYLSKSQLYKELQEEYKYYIGEIASFIRKLDLKSSEEVIMYLQALMENGLLSVNFRHEYKKFKYDNEYLTHITGARVLTGKCVCRHMASFFADVLSEVGYKSCVVVLNNYTDVPSPEDLDDRDMLYTHAAVAVIKDGCKYIYCPTGAFFYDKFDDYTCKENGDYLAHRIVKRNQKPGESNERYFLLSYDQCLYNFYRLDLATHIVYIPSCSLDPYDIEKKYKLVKSAFFHTMPMAYNLRQSLSKEMESISSKSLILSPCSDKPITSWKIK